MKEINKMGLSFYKKTVCFRMFAPNAFSVDLLIFDDMESSMYSENPTKIYSMTPEKIFENSTEKDGKWICCLNKKDFVKEKSYYKYRIKYSEKTYEVADIWGYAASPNSKSSQIIDINNISYLRKWGEKKYKNPFGKSGKKKMSYSQAIIYEMHIRDWSRAFVKNSTGKFDDITANLKNNGKFAQHLKDLGVTHVQILPMFDYAQTNEDSSYNWGYNPYHYNVPEGRYVNNMISGFDAVIQMRNMIKAFHDEGIAVIMDVVYNHTSGTDEYSLFDMTVPKYFYRINSDGTYSNGSGCGNEFDTSKQMSKEYVIESLKHWMLDYHVNGFRFDLMGLHEKSFMKEVYEQLYKIDPNVMIYGEPWTGGLSLTENPSTETIFIAEDIENGVGAFDDEFRDAIKGGEFGGFGTGQIQGNFKDFQIEKGLKGFSSRNSFANKKPNLTIHYAECHDNYTLNDKLAISLLSGNSCEQWQSFDEFTKNQQDILKKQNKLAAAYLFLAQGTPFLNGGQEFCRTKHGDENSYQSSDEINEIDLSFKAKFIDVFNVYKGLIEFRKNNSESFGSNINAHTETIFSGLTKYVSNNFCVYFNATQNDYELTLESEYSKIVNISSGKPVEENLPYKLVVPSIGFLILKK